jgi:hypothetical protein
LKSPKGDLKVFDVSLDHPFSLRDIRLKAGMMMQEMVSCDSVQRFMCLHGRNHCCPPIPVLVFCSAVLCYETSG